MKVVLAYSGGLDTSVAIRWLAEHYDAEVITVTVDVGEVKDYEAIREKALRIGAAEAFLIDAKDEFASEFITPCLKANAIYEDGYPLATAMARPLIAKKVVEVAHEVGADAVAHGATGKGNDQVRFEVTFRALDPSLKIIAPAREWGMSREEEIEYAKERGIPIPVGIESPYSIDQNLWGRSIECGKLEDPAQEPPEEVFEWTAPLDRMPDEPQYIKVEFEQGVPVSIDGERMSLVRLISSLNDIAGRHGVGRVDMIENRLVGIKSREVYEAPAAITLITAHRALEALTIERDLIHFKRSLELKYAELVYYGLWYHPLREALDAFMDHTQRTVTGAVRLKLFKGSCMVVGRESPFSLYRYELATYDRADQFDHRASEGFIKIFGLPTAITRSVLRQLQE
ncbi:MAG: argininosuccinate synthase [Armatimonadota bacterium]|nr:argininosuccinate synthase [Armatimonadota bacterium]MCX7776835.1 argininosuccinate synthase [Armatimonadota bacterium]MDW8024479.1 argininosuccinate synthase [Armatimonadota bacterium]